VKVYEVRVVCAAGVARTIEVSAASPGEAIEKIRAILPRLCNLTFQCTPVEQEDK